MANVTGALEYLTKPENFPPMPVIIIFGDDPFLAAEVFQSFRGRILPEEDAEYSLTTFDAKGSGGEADADSGADDSPLKRSLAQRSLTFLTVLRELSTRAMFGGETRLVRVLNADGFLSEFGPSLEDYLDAPASGGILILQTLQCASNTRIYKKTAEKGLLIDVRAPAAGELTRWLIGWGKRRHALKIPSDAAALLVDMIGPEPGLLNQELARLAVSIPAGEQVTRQLISEKVGAWRLRKVWDMIDAVLGGNLPEGLRQLDLLLAAGENPVGILAQIAPTLRRFAAATTLYLDSEKSGRRVPLAETLRSAGFPPFVVQKSAEQMKRLGRFRGERLLSLLAETDLAMKGASRADVRILLERFLIELGHPELRNANVF